jgi:dTDP-glucose 4,6-dehydratase
MRIVVTGGAGFIGSAVIRRLLRTTAHDVINIDKLTYAGNLANLAPVLPNPRYRFEQIDICDRHEVQRVFEQQRPDAILHLAAESHVDRSIDAPAAFVKTNVDGTLSLLQAAEAHRQKYPAAFRFLHVSTDEVFGSLGASGRFTEASALAPRSPYAASKAAAEALVRAWHHTFGLPILISTSCNNYGPYQFPEKLVPTVILAALQQRPIPVYGTGVNVRDWLYVDDHAAALIAVLERGRIGETYLIGGRRDVSNIELVRLICRQIDDLVPGRGPHEDLIEFVQDRPGHDLRYAVDPSKAERELGWQATTSLDSGLQQTIAWYLANPGWCEAIAACGFHGERLGLGERQSALPETS